MFAAARCAPPADAEPVDLGVLVQRVCDAYGPAAAANGLSLELTIEPGGGDPAPCDADVVADIVARLVDNAVTFTRTGGVHVRLARRGDQVGVAVRDTGSGFDDAAKARLSERFHSGGAGGLAACAQHVRRIGGEIDCESTPGEGSVFAVVLDLPLADAAPVACVMAA